MLAELRTFSFRSMALFLALVIAAFPAVAMSAMNDCSGHEQPATTCCKHHQKAPESDSPATDTGAQDCGLTCLSVCCRAIDVPRGDLQLVGDQALVLPVLVIAQSVHTPLTSDAIFHPPRS